MNLSRFNDLDVVLICGLPCSGKSHFSKTYFRNTDRKRINRKEIRRLLFEMTNFGEKWSENYFNEHDEFLVKHVERKICEHLLQNKQKILIDNTSISISSRKSYISIAKQMGKSIGIVLLNTPFSKCLERNKGREDSIPDTVISNLAAALELPDRAEGFREVKIIEDY